MLEKHIQQQIIHYLQAKGWYVQRMNSGQYAVGEGRNRRYIMGAAAGTPDIMAFKPIKSISDVDRVDLIFVEVKQPGNKPTPLQEAKMKELESFGAQCLVATSIDDVQAQGI